MEKNQNTLKTDKNYRELAEHGSALFPIACYHDDLTLNDVLWHWHEELEAIYITSGSATVTAGKETYILSEGEGVFINAGVMHSIVANSTDECRFHSLVYHPRLLSGGIDSVFYQKYLQPVLTNPSFKSVHLRTNIPWQKLVLEGMEISWYHCLYRTPGYEFKVRSALSDITFHVWSHLPAVPKLPDSKSLRDSERTKTMLQFVHDNYHTELSTKMIADSIGISESECLRCFHSTINTTPIQYVKQYRIQQAAHMLVFSNDKIADIAAKCGFQDMSYFTKTFRQLKGCVPTEYRNSNTGNA
ncbi:MAG: AraC family transcriptional regulator [Oscillospiraceae bacterium]|nr:AraC family transcriptional regulator [Oscillospiraceae bacterium]